MPNRKQRRRRDKDFRHDVRVYELDDEGNEIPIAELRQREEKPAKAPAKAKAQKGGKPSREIREVQPASWQRAIKRGGLMGSLMVIVFVFVLKTGPPAQRVAIGLFYAAAFIPLTYFIDRTAYRSYLKRLDRQSGGKAKAAKS